MKLVSRQGCNESELGELEGGHLMAGKEWSIYPSADQNPDIDSLWSVFRVLQRCFELVCRLGRVYYERATVKKRVRVEYYASDYPSGLLKSYQKFTVSGLNVSLSLDRDLID